MTKNGPLRIGNFKGILSHGFRFDELPSVGYPLYMLCLIMLLGVSGLIDMSNGEIFFAPMILAFLVLPALALAAKTAWQTKQPTAILPLFVLYLIYGCARAFSVLKALFKGFKKGWGNFFA